MYCRQSPQLRPTAGTDAAGWKDRWLPSSARPELSAWLCRHTILFSARAPEDVQPKRRPSPAWSHPCQRQPYPSPSPERRTKNYFLCRCISTPIASSAEAERSLFEELEVWRRRRQLRHTLSCGRSRHAPRSEAQSSILSAELSTDWPPPSLT